MNIAFRVELERIFAGVTRCVLPNHPFPVGDFITLIPEAPELAKSLAERAVKGHPCYEEMEKLGLSVVVFPILLSRVLKLTFAPDIQVFVCDSEWKEELEKSLERIRRDEEIVLRSGDERRWAKIVRSEGRILGYPKCCVEGFVGGKLRNDPPETRLIRRCIEEGVLERIYELLKNPSEPDEDLFVFFTSNFYPCDLGCERALRIGLTVRESLNGRMKKAYDLKVVLNSANLLMSAYGTYRFLRVRGAKTEFGRVVEDFFENKDVEFLNAIFESYSSDPLGFEERFISAHLD